MSDLKKDAESIRTGAEALGRVTHHTSRPLQAFKEQAQDLSALGALGSLLGAKDDIAEGMATLARLTRELNEEWEDEAKAMNTISDAFDLLDALLGGQGGTDKG
ncbi:hypothetical protein [Streptomyces olivaceiscleroticus]|uniref:Uncharacterized protein n=1 Tax=Streptomyces olivaceiscleroticus TaxID=68245 RepID=A0ABN1B6L8_9ACTN